MPKKFIGAEHVREKDLTLGVEVLDTNKTLFVAPLNGEAGDDTKPVECRTMGDVFTQFRPGVEVSVTGEDGTPVQDEILFEQVSDFLPESVIAQSPTLKSLHTEMLLLKDMLFQLRNNQTLRRAVDTPAEREVLVKGLRAARTAIGVKES